MSVKELLEKIEWDKNNFCPICNNLKYADDGHKKDCRLGQALALLAKPEPNISDIAIPCPDECGGVLEVKKFIDRPTCNECGKVFVLCVEQVCKKCGGSGEVDVWPAKGKECKAPCPDCQKPKLDFYYSKDEVKKIIEGVLQRVLSPKRGTSPAGDIAEQIYCYLAIQKIEAEHKKQPEPTELVKELRTAIKRYRIGQVDVDVDWAIEKFVESLDIIDTLQAEIERLKTQAKKAYFAIEMLVPNKFIGLIKIPNGQVYSHRAFWETLFGDEPKEPE